MGIIVIMMNSKNERYVGVEAVMDIICRACCMKSVESVVESWISVLEHHSSKVRNLKEESILTELMVAVNGPPVHHCESLVRDSMQVYWRKPARAKDLNGHFVRRSRNIKTWLVSKAVDNFNEMVPDTPFLV